MKSVIWVGPGPSYAADLPALSWAIVEYLPIERSSRNEIMAAARAHDPKVVVFADYDHANPYDRNIWHTMRDAGVGVVFLVSGSDFGPLLNAGLIEAPDVLGIENIDLSPLLQRHTLAGIMAYPQTAEQMVVFLNQAAARRTRVPRCCATKERLR